MASDTQHYGYMDYAGAPDSDIAGTSRYEMELTPARGTIGSETQEPNMMDLMKRLENELKILGVPQETLVQSHEYSEDMCVANKGKSHKKKKKKTMLGNSVSTGAIGSKTQEPDTNDVMKRLENELKNILTIPQETRVQTHHSEDKIGANKGKNHKKKKKKTTYENSVSTGVKDGETKEPSSIMDLMKRLENELKELSESQEIPAQTPAHSEDMCVVNKGKSHKKKKKIMHENSVSRIMESETQEPNTQDLLKSLGDKLKELIVPQEMLVQTHEYSEDMFVANKGKSHKKKKKEMYENLISTGAIVSEAGECSTETIGIDAEEVNMKDLTMRFDSELETDSDPESVSSAISEHQLVMHKSRKLPTLKTTKKLTGRKPKKHTIWSREKKNIQVYTDAFYQAIDELLKEKKPSKLSAICHDTQQSPNSLNTFPECDQELKTLIT